MGNSTGERRWGKNSPTWIQSGWIDAIRLAPPWLRRPLQRHFRKTQEPKWTAPLDIVVRNLKFRCHFSDNTPEYKLLFQGRRLDSWHLRALSPFLHARGTFVDIGANFGFFSLNAAKSMGDLGRILAIEPNSIMVKRLRENIRLNGIKSILVRDIAVGESHGVAASQAGGRDHGGAGYGTLGAGESAGRPVSMMPLLDAVREAGFEKIDVLKIDIEGFEGKALTPFFNTAPKSLWPHIMAVEDSHKDRWDSNLIDQLIGRSYRVIARGRVDHVLKLNPA